MAKYLRLSNENFTVGKKVLPFVHRPCHYCKGWFKFRYDTACSEIATNGFFKLICPYCEKEYVYEREMHLPDTYMKFVEID